MSLDPPPRQLACVQVSASTHDGLESAASAVRPFEIDMAIFAASEGADGFKPTMRLHVQASPAPPPQAGATITHPAPPTPSNAASSRAAGTTPTPATAASKVRPMTLAPIILEATGATTEASGGAHPLDSGDPPPPPGDLPPGLDFSGENTVPVMSGGVAVPGEYKVEDPVPVGTMAFIMVSSPDPRYMIVATDWWGGSDYKSYFSSPSDTDLTGGQTLGKDPDLHAMDYEFIVDADVRTYTITNTVTYLVSGTFIAHGTSTLTFTSDRPTAGIAVLDHGTPSAIDHEKAKGVQLSPPIEVAPTASTDDYTGGSFMMMQILNHDYVQESFVGGLRDGEARYRKNDHDDTATGGQNFNGPLLDDGLPVGYTVFSYGSWPGSPAGGIGPGRALAPNTSVPQYPPLGLKTNDGPETKELVLDGIAQMSQTSAFSMYLMYEPEFNGAWIALDELDWSWSASAAYVVDQDNNKNWTILNSQQPNPSELTPTGDFAFPTWANTTAAYRDETSDPWLPGDPGP